MTIEQEVHKSETSAKIELIKLDFSTTNVPELSGVLFRMCPAHLSNSGITFNGEVYLPWAVMIDGIDEGIDAAPARPQLHIGNVSGNPDFNRYIGALAFSYFDLNQTTVYYYRTFANLLAAGMAVPRKYTIAKKLSHDKDLLVFELRDPTDKERSYMPGRQMLRDQFPGLGVNKHV